MRDGERSLAGPAQLVADASRAEMLAALMDGRAWTGRELARMANVTPSTASAHLKRLVNGALLAVVPQGRHCYYRIASPQVAHALESLMVLAAPAQPRHPTARAIDNAMRQARTCYDHLAGVLGVSLADALRTREAIEFDENGARFTPAGVSLFARLGIVYEVPENHVGAKSTGKRPLCRACLDWSERRPHLAGMVGAALCHHALENEWVRRRPGTRALDVTARGTAELREAFGITWKTEKD